MPLKNCFLLLPSFRQIVRQPFQELRLRPVYLELRIRYPEIFTFINFREFFHLPGLLRPFESKCVANYLGQIAGPLKGPRQKGFT